MYTSVSTNWHYDDKVVKYCRTTDTGTAVPKNLTLCTVQYIDTQRLVSDWNVCIENWILWKNMRQKFFWENQL
jgi:hypothetical protein